MKKYVIDMYFSFCEVIEAKTEEEAVLKVEKMVEKELTEHIWNYFDDRTIEEVEE